jgi:ATP/maltotriose-dependent transcriptional regulator MalT
MQAVELLGMAFSRPSSDKAWLEQLPLLTRLRAALETELGAEAFSDAWERGKARDLDEVVNMLLEQFRGVSDSTQVTEVREANRNLLEPLSERELEVLQLIANGLTNEEIAGRLFVSVSTVKKHINHIYSKIGAASRTQAIVRAREFNLL